MPPQAAQGKAGAQSGEQSSDGAAQQQIGQIYQNARHGCEQQSRQELPDIVKDPSHNAGQLRVMPVQKTAAQSLAMKQSSPPHRL